jgi:outer membrane protein assembly factor BamB
MPEDENDLKYELLKKDEAAPEESMDPRAIYEHQAKEMSGAIGFGVTVYNEIIYFGSCDNNIYAIREDDGKLMWKFLAEGMVSSRIDVTDGVAYATSFDGYVYALDANTGRLIWRFYTGDKVVASPTVAYDIVYVGSFDTYFYAIEAPTGRLLWKFKTDNLIWCEAAVINGKVFFGSVDKRLYCLDAKTGKLLWSYLANGWCTVQASASSDGHGIWRFGDRPDRTEFPDTVIVSGSWSNDLFAVDEDGRKLWHRQTDSKM